MNTTPVSLLERLRQPANQDAWSRFVKLYTPLLHFWVRRTGFSETEADDLVQEVFAALVQKLPAFAYDKVKTFRGWLRTVAVNKWRELKRKKAIATGPMPDRGRSLPRQHHHRIERVRLLHQAVDRARQQDQRGAVDGMVENQAAEDAARRAELPARECVQRLLVAELQADPTRAARLDQF